MTDSENLLQRLANLSSSKRALVERLLKQNRGRTPIEETIARRANRDLAPLSFAQQRLWFIHQLDPESSAYNEAMAVRLQGSLNVEALKHALNVVVERHESLRTSFSVIDGANPVQLIGESRPVDLRLFNLSADTGKERDVETQRIAAELKARPFDLCQDLMLRAGLIRLSPNEHVLIVIMHHIASDAWSSGLFRRELATLYEAFSQGKPNPLPELSIQYADYAVWQRQWLQGEVLEEQLSYWRERLAVIPVLELPTDRPRPAVQTYRGAKQSLHLPRSLSDQLKALSSQNGVTLFMTLLAAFQTLLHRHTGQEEIVIGTPIAGRNRVELENIIGFFVNTLVVRTDFTGEPTFQKLLARVREVALGAYAHQDLPFEKLVEELQPERTVGTSPLFQVTFGFQNLREETFRLRGMIVTPLEVDSGTAKFDLSLRIREHADGLRAVFEYNTDLFDSGMIDRLLGHYQKLLESIVKDTGQRISEIPILTEAEQYQLLTEWNRTDVDYPSHRCVHQLFEEQAQRTPEAVAAVFEDRQLTYAELNSRANQLARHLRTFGVGPDVLVGLCMERSLEMVVGLLGILKAGGAYVPLDPDYPQERLAFILNDTQGPVFITQKRLMEHRRWTVEDRDSRSAKFDRPIQVIFLDSDWDKIASESDDNLENLTSLRHLAYLIYTSGSSGMPKGVAVEHKSLLNYSLDIVRRLQPETGSSFAMVQPLTVDSCITMIFPCLATGGALHIISREKVLNAADLSDYFRRGSIDFLKIAPSHLAALQASPSAARLMPRRCLIIGGEGSRWDWVESLQARAPSCTIYNHYGPTETTVGVLMYRVRESPTKQNFLHTPLGRPIANTQAYLLDKHLRPVPIGVIGELYIGGDGLARGYCNRPELTTEKFITHAFDGEPPRRLYKTGDLARYFPDGNIEFLGRVDNQVKIRGYRIEPGEIESILRQHSQVKETVVTVREDEPGDKRLIAYVVLKNDFARNSTALRSYLKEKLPGYMAPSAFVFLNALPLTPHGKLDQRALPAPEQTRPELAERYQAPRNPVEESLARIWAEVLKLEKVGIDDNFFDLGGHSLKAVQVISRARKTFEVELPLRRLFETPTIVGLADTIATLCWAKQSAAQGDAALTSEEETGEV